MEGLTCHLRLFFSSFCCVVLVSCAKSDDILPPKTHEGRNTCGFIYGSQVVGGEFGNGDTTFINEDTIHFSFTGTHIGILTGTDLFLLKMKIARNGLDLNLVDSEFATGFESGFSQYHFLNTSEPYYCEFHYHNFIERVVSAEFELPFHEIDTVVYSDTTFIDTGQTFYLREGRFDIRY